MRNDWKGWMLQKKLDADIDELIDANNNLIQDHNDNTLVFGELAKKIISRLDFYLPPLADDIEQIQNNARPQEKNFRTRLTLMSLNK